jgi:GNAT superfamily N-acetyltransferase
MLGQAVTYVAIAPARASDASMIADLTGELGYEVTAGEVERRLSAILGDDNHAVFVGRAGDDVIGWIHVVGVRRLEATFFAELGGLVVQEAARRQGVGRRLVDAALKWAGDRGYRTLRVRTNVVRADAPRFYESLGFTRVKDQMVFAQEIHQRRH